MGIKAVQVILSNEAEDFIKLQDIKVQLKITYNIRKLESGIIDTNIFKKLENSAIWEIRTLFNGICYRLFSFWDTDNETWVIVTHGIVKKTQKTPKKEIRKAKAIMTRYFQNKSTDYVKNDF